MNAPLFYIIDKNRVFTDESGGYNLGALGQAEVECLRVKIDSKGLYLNCEGGFI
jgi:hypothetical protein